MVVWFTPIYLRIYANVVRSLGYENRPRQSVHCKSIPREKRGEGGRGEKGGEGGRGRAGAGMGGKEG